MKIVMTQTQLNVVSVSSASLTSVSLSGASANLGVLTISGLINVSLIC